MRLGGLGISRRFEVVQRQLATLPNGLREMQQASALLLHCCSWQRLHRQRSPHCTQAVLCGSHGRTPPLVVAGYCRSI